MCEVTAVEEDIPGWPVYLYLHTHVVSTHTNERQPGGSPPNIILNFFKHLCLLTIVYFPFFPPLVLLYVWLKVTEWQSWHLWKSLGRQGRKHHILQQIKYKGQLQACVQPLGLWVQDYRSHAHCYPRLTH